MSKPYYGYVISKPDNFPEFRPVGFIKRGHSPTRSVLRYLKMKRGTPITAQQVKDIFPVFFRKPSDASRILKTLERRDFAECAYEGAWRITGNGINAIHLLARRDTEKRSDYEVEKNSYS